MPTPAGPKSPDPPFPPTRWTLILDLRSGDAGAADRALTELCRLYWYPVYAFVRRQGSGPEDAQDLTQSFFARLLERNDLAGVQQEKGRLRTYLLGAMKNHLIQDWRHRSAQKRGGGHPALPLDAEGVEKRYASEQSHLCSPDALFDRRWALDTMAEALRRLEEEYNDSGRTELHGILQPFLSSRPAPGHVPEAAIRLGMTDGAFHVALHRLRQRFRRILESLVADTVGSQEEAADELKHLLSLLSS
ncbi:MAG: hypothetical protein JWL81_2462 [Verrucomicrobiales bacterium]|nr:hypothetical protein [Verrucomicrobiales bacterium]